MPQRKVWLSRQRDGNYMLTRLQPVRVKILGTEFYDFYLQHGEPIGVRHLCPGGIKSIFGIDIPIGEQIEVWIEGGELKK